MFHIFYVCKFLELRWISRQKKTPRPKLSSRQNGHVSPEAYFDMIGFRPGDARLLAAPRRQDVFPKGVWFEGLGM